MVFSLKARMEEQAGHLDKTFSFSISLPCGHSTNWLQKDGEVFEIGRATSKIFGTYKKKVLEDKGIKVNLAVEMNATIFWGEASKKDLVSIIKVLADDSFENEKFNQVKKRAINDLKHNYRNEEYKALFKSYELIFYSQQFNFQEFILSHRNLKIESLEFIQKNIVTKENVYMFIDGEFEKEAIERILPRAIKNQSMIVFPTISKSFNFDYRVSLRGNLNDEHLVVKFNSHISDSISREKEFLILTFWGQQYFGRNYSVYNHFSNKAICGIRKKGLPMDIEHLMISENVFDEIKKIIISSFEKLANTNDGEFAILKGKLRMDSLDWNKLQQELEKINLQDVLAYLDKEKRTIQYGQITFSGELNYYGR
ncbi:hypothetical protein LISE100100_13875 [Listeria seeligeri]|uniref:hypothetical protein n=2 Tax=Listeria TaxID=1637 RepID=UPI0001C4E400|nr:hypothetical protein [Listeria seeligeri]CBH26202.1 hypothetical protein lse_0051 [Listeria seeligeri serovar 1/2b str. SLCC3954]